MLGISWVAAQLAASQKGLSSMNEWMFQISSYICQYMYQLCVVCFYWFYICGIFLMYLGVFLFFSVFMMFILSVILPYVCPVLSIWFKYPELPLLFLSVYVIYIWCQISGPFILCILLGNPCISFGNCHFFTFVYLWMGFYYVPYCFHK
jgi:hypothetical protein